MPVQTVYAASLWKLFGNISAKSRKKKVISPKMTTDSIIRAFLNINNTLYSFELKSNTLYIQLIQIHRSNL